MLDLMIIDVVLLLQVNASRVGQAAVAMAAVSQ